MGADAPAGGPLLTQRGAGGIDKARQRAGAQSSPLRRSWSLTFTPPLHDLRGVTRQGGIEVHYYLCFICVCFSVLAKVVLFCVFFVFFFAAIFEFLLEIFLSME